MPESIINLIKGDKAGEETDYRDALSVNMHTVIRPMFGVQGYLQQSYGLTLYGSTDLPDAVLKPVNIYPDNGADVEVDDLIVRSSAFAYRGDEQTHTKTDWQFASDAGFTNIIHESLDDAVNLVAYDVSNQVPDDAITYWRCRHYGDITGASAWSDGTNFNTADDNKVLQPTNIFPAEGAQVDLSELVLQSSDFAVEGEAQTHVSSDWQIAYDPGFTDIYWESLDDTENLTAVVVAGGNPITQPSNTFPADRQGGIDFQNITVTGSAFAVAFGPAQTHTATDWQFASDAGFTNIIHESLNDTQNLESYDVSNNVPDDTVTYWRHRHYGSVTGASEWSVATRFDTSDPKFSPADLFENGTYDGTWLDPSDLSTMFQDEGGAVPVTQDGDRVQLMLDISGNGAHAFQDSAGRGPIYRTDGTRHWLEFNNSNQEFLKIPQVTQGNKPRCVSAGLNKASFGNVSSPQGFFSLSETSSGGTGNDWSPSHEGSSLLVRVSGNAEFAYVPSAPQVGEDFTSTIQWATSLGTSVFATQCFYNGVELTRTGGSTATINTTTTPESGIGRSVKQQNTYYNGRIYQIVAINRLLDATELDDLHAFIREKMGITP